VSVHATHRYDVEFDTATKASKFAIRGLSFEWVVDVVFATQEIWQDMRKHYRDTRFVAISYLDNRLHVLVFGKTVRGIRVISFRQANVREEKKHGFTLTRN
jgi:uncharacterized DUF497 family protein